MHSLPEKHISESIYDSIARASALSTATKKIVLGKPDVAIWLWFWPVLCSHTSLSRHSWVSVEWCYFWSDTCHCVLSFTPNNSITALIILLFLEYVSFFQTRRWTSFVNTSEIVSVKMSPASKDLLLKQFFSHFDQGRSGCDQTVISASSSVCLMSSCGVELETV